MSDEEFEELMKKTESDIDYIMDGYYSGLELDIISRLRIRLKHLVVTKQGVQQ